MSTLVAILSSSTAEARRTNYLAIFIGAIVAFVIASVYYGVVFLDLWLQVRRLNPTSMSEVSTSPTQPFVEFLTTLVIAFAIGHLVARLGITHVRDALQLAAILWIAFPGMLWVGAMLGEHALAVRSAARRRLADQMRAVYADSNCVAAEIAQMMYVILIYSNPASRSIWESFTPEQRAAGLSLYAALNEDLTVSGELIVSEALAGPDMAKRVALQQDQLMVTDGPFAEAKEQLAGFYLLECESIERAIEHAARVPEARLGLVEVRPVMDLKGFEM